MAPFLPGKRIFYLLTSILLTGCASKKPKITILQDIANPLKTERAVLFLEEGDEVVNSLNVKVICYTCTIDNKDVKNNFTIDTTSVNQESRAELIKLNWLTPDSLKVQVDYRIRPFLKQPESERVKIILEEF